MMGFYIPWLADASRLTGYPVVEVAGWQQRGHGGMRVVEGIVNHHTADGPNGNYPSLNIVRSGRAGLRGPLSHLGLGRDGTIFVIAAGLSYHAGASTWANFRDLNDEFIGIEAESVGTRDDWSGHQRDCYPRLNAALLYYMKRKADRVCAHKECCIPKGRKVDLAFWNMNVMRAQVHWYLQDPLARIPKFKNARLPKISPSTKSKMLVNTANHAGLGGIVIPYSLPRTATPDEGADSLEWPYREETIQLGYVGGWRGKCMVRLAWGHPGARVFRAHFDTPDDKGHTVVKQWPGVNPEGKDWPGGFFNPAYKAGYQMVIEAPLGATTLMITYAAPGGGSLNLEWEK